MVSHFSYDPSSCLHKIKFSGVRWWKTLCQIQCLQTLGDMWEGIVQPMTFCLEISQTSRCISFQLAHSVMAILIRSQMFNVLPPCLLCQTLECCGAQNITLVKMKKRVSHMKVEFPVKLFFISELTPGERIFTYVSLNHTTCWVCFEIPSLPTHYTLCAVCTGRFCRDDKTAEQTKTYR